PAPSSTACCNSRATRAWGACARRSTTRCRSKACVHWWATCENLLLAMADPTPPTNPELLKLRDQIDAVDRQLLALLNQRAALAQTVGEVKKKEGSVVFRPTAAGAADFGVVPVENSTEGVVARSLDLFLTEPLFIIGETSLFVRQNLLRRENDLQSIQAVCAHPQALAQCHGWLSNHLPN